MDVEAQGEQAQHLELGDESDNPARGGVLDFGVAEAAGVMDEQVLVAWSF